MGCSERGDGRGQQLVRSYRREAWGRFRPNLGDAGGGDRNDDDHDDRRDDRTGEAAKTRHAPLFTTGRRERLAHEVEWRTFVTGIAWGASRRSCSSAPSFVEPEPNGGWTPSRARRRPSVG